MSKVLITANMDSIPDCSNLDPAFIRRMMVFPLRSYWILTDRRHANVVKYRIRASCYATTAFVFCCLHCNTLVFIPAEQWSNIGKAILAGNIMSQRKARVRSKTFIAKKTPNQRST
jgi:hypothetical protein